MSLLKFTRKKRIVPISATTDIVVVDRNGYIGEKRPNVNTVYFGYLDTFADYSQAGLGQVTIIPVVIGKVTIGGREYKTTKIGGQEWLAENLDFKFDVNGSQIPIGVSGTPATPAAWYYDNDESTYGIDRIRKCGLLYNWYAVDYLEQNKLTLIPGWHVASAQEWDDLAIYIGGINTAGLILKSVTLDWAPNWRGLDIYGFNSVPTGYRTSNFSSVGIDCGTWTSTPNGNQASLRYFLASMDGMGSNNTNNKANACPVRLVRDSE